MKKTKGASAMGWGSALIYIIGVSAEKWHVVTESGEEIYKRKKNIKENIFMIKIKAITLHL